MPNENFTESTDYTIQSTSNDTLYEGSNKENGYKSFLHFCKDLKFIKTNHILINDLGGQEKYPIIQQMFGKVISLLGAKAAETESDLPAIVQVDISTRYWILCIIIVETA